MAKSYRAKAIEARDEVCENCGSTHEIEVHHRDRNRCNNDLDNLVVLCHDCHDTVHNGWPDKGTLLWDLHIDTGVRLPEPVYREVVSQSELKDVPPGAVVREWMDKAEQYEEMQRR